MSAIQRETFFWLDALEHCTEDHARIDAEIARARLELDEVVCVKEKERADVDAKYRFLKVILTAGSDDGAGIDSGLSGSVAEALRTLGFEVSPLEDEVRATTRSDGYWVRDGDYVALAEVAATTAANIGLGEYTGLLSRMALILRYRDALAGGQSPAGLLIVNHDRAANPFHRRKLYGSGEHAVLRDASDQKIGLLSTVDLYTLVVALGEELLSASEAREWIKQPGRIDPDPDLAQVSSPAELVEPSHIVIDGHLISL